MTIEKNSLQKALSKNGEAVIFALDATELVQESLDRLGCWPPAAKHLGQAMMAAALLQALGDSDTNESISLQWMCDGPFGHLFAEARNYGEVRGTIQNPRAAVSDYGTPLGKGLLQVRRSRNGIGTTSVVNAVGDVTADLVEYLEKSEQKNCGINLSVHVEWKDKAKTAFRVRSACGYLVHILPQPTDQKLNDLLFRWDRQMQALGPISSWLLREGSETTDILRLLLATETPNTVMTQRVVFSCTCSSARASRALALLEAQEKKEGALKKAASTEIRCEYCGKTYTIGAQAKAAKKRARARATKKKKSPAASAKRKRKK